MGKEKQGVENCLRPDLNPYLYERHSQLNHVSVSKGLKGIYHLTGSGYASRYEVSRYFLERIGMDNLILPVGSDYFPVPARRPYFSALSNQKLANDLNVDIPDWKIGIDRYIEATFEKEAIR